VSKPDRYRLRQHRSPPASPLHEPTKAQLSNVTKELINRHVGKFGKKRQFGPFSFKWLAGK